MTNVVDGRVRPNAGAPARNGFGTFQVHYASTAQKNYVARLYRERDTSGIPEPDYATLNKRAASDIIGKLLARNVKGQPTFGTGIMSPVATATDKQLSFVKKLAGERAWSVGDEIGDTVSAVLNGDTVPMKAASRAIDTLLKAPVTFNSRTGEPVRKCEPGVYRLDGQVYIVKPNKAKTNMYAQRLVEIGGTRITEAGTFVNVDFEYAPGVIFNLTPDHKLGVDEGKALTIRYGKCICCKRNLKAKQSVERGIGPVCIKYYV